MLPRVSLVGPMPPSLGGLVPGGVATHLAHLTDGLAQAGVPVSLLATNVPAPGVDAWRWEQAPYPFYRSYAPARVSGWLQPRYLRAVGAARVVRYGLQLARMPAALLGSRSVAAAQLLWYRRFIAETRPQVLHVQHPLERHLYARLVAEWEGWRLPLVVTLHSFFREHADALIYGLMQPNLPHADRLIAVSRTTAEQAVALGADPERIRVIRSGVDAEHFRPGDRAGARQRLGLDADVPLVLFVGNLESRKAVDRLLRALPVVRASVPDATLAILGSGDTIPSDNQEPVLRRLAAELGLLPDAARFLGRCAADELLDWYVAADVFSLPSRSEGQGIVALEAMACGLPVVVSAVGGLLDTVVDGENGYLVPDGDEPLLAAHLSRLLQDAPLRRRLGMAARTSVVKNFSWKTALRATIAVYQELA